MNPKFIFIVRSCVALIWFYQGLWLKIVASDPHHLAVVQSVGFASPLIALHAIGAGETLLGLGVLSGLFHRFVAGFQILLLVAMNSIGILFSHGAIENPAGLIINNLPFLLCILTVGIYGPGAWTPGARR